MANYGFSWAQPRPGSLWGSLEQLEDHLQWHQGHGERPVHCLPAIEPLWATAKVWLRFPSGRITNDNHPCLGGHQMINSCRLVKYTTQLLLPIQHHQPSVIIKKHHHERFIINQSDFSGEQHHKPRWKEDQEWSTTTIKDWWPQLRGSLPTISQWRDQQGCGRPESAWPWDPCCLAPLRPTWLDVMAQV